MRIRSAGRPAVLAAVASALLLAGCAAGPSGSPTGPTPAEDAPAGQAPAGDAVAAAAALVQQRYELVRDGDYAGACELYSDEFAALFAELAAVPEGSSCVQAHEAAAQTVTDYLADVEAQQRPGLTPFFYVPSEIEVDAAAIVSDEPGLAFLGQGTVVSLDPREFEDGTGKTPGWLAGQDYVMQGADGAWRFIASFEQ